MSSIERDPIYCSLEQNESRLVHLAPGKHGDPIACTLVQLSILEPPLYEALSYVWGDTAITAPITVNGFNLQVTTGLEVALRHLRLCKKSRTLWIDAISINQQDVKERAQQVLHMASIYSKAESVRIWLGPADPYSALYLNYLKRSLSNKISRSLSRFYVHWKARAHFWGSQDDDGKQESLLGSRRADQIGKLFSCYSGMSRESLYRQSGFMEAMIAFHFLQREWFSRRWCIQKLALSQKAIIQCGLESADWLSMFVALQMAYPHTLPDATSEFEEVGYKIVAYDFTLFPLGGITGDVPYKAPISDLLFRFRHWHNGDPKDTVYGLLAIAGLRGSGIKIDYTKSDVHVLVDVFEYVIRHEDLSLVGVPWAPDISGLPTWIVPTHRDNTCANVDKDGFVSQFGSAFEVGMSEQTVNVKIVRPKEHMQPSRYSSQYILFADGITLKTYGDGMSRSVHSTESSANDLLSEIFNDDSMQQSFEVIREPGDRIVALFGCNHLLVWRPIERDFVIVRSWLGNFWNLVRGKGTDDAIVYDLRKEIQEETKILLRALPTETFAIV